MRMRNWATAVAGIAVMGVAIAQTPKTEPVKPAAATAPETAKPADPLSAMLTEARAAYAKTRDYSGTFTRQERINGLLSAEQVGETIPCPLTFEGPQPQEVTELEDGDDNGDPGGESGGHRMGHELDQPAQPEQAHHHQNETSHRRGSEQPDQPELGGDRDQEDHERSSRARNCVHRAAGQGDDDACDDGRVQPVLRGCAGRDGEGHRKRECHQAQDQASHGISPEIGSHVAALGYRP